MAMMKPKATGAKKPVGKRMESYNKGSEYKSGITSGIKSGSKKTPSLAPPIAARKRARELNNLIKVTKRELYKIEKIRDTPALTPIGRKVKDDIADDSLRLTNARRGKYQGRLIARNSQTSRRVSNKGKTAVRRGRGD